MPATPFVPFPNVALVELVQMLDSQVLENTLYFKHSGSIAVSDLGVLATAAIAWWVGNIKPGVADDLTLTGCAVTDLTTATAPAVFTPVIPAEAGDGPSPAEPNEVALCVSFRSAGRGRSSRGRNYVAGLQQSQVVNSHVTAGVTDFFAGAYQQLVGADNLATGWTWVVASRMTNKAFRPVGVTADVIAAVCVDNILDSQRRRQPGRGR